MNHAILGDQLAWAQALPTEIQAVLGDLVPHDSADAGERGAALADVVLGIDHVGFITADTRDVVLQTAASVGLAADPVPLRSQVIARELGALCGQDEVETWIVRLTRTQARRDTANPSIEVFVPTGVEAGLVVTWATGGVASHIALAVADERQGLAAAALLERWGYSRPAFLDRVTLDGGLSVTYLDHPAPTAIRRIELCRRS